MRIKHIYNLAIASAVTAGMTGCQKDFLDTKIDVNQTEQTLNSNWATLSARAVAPYTFLRNEFTIMDNNIFAAVSDEAVQTLPTSNAMLFNNGSWNAVANPDTYYGTYYQGIRAANFFMENSADYRTFLAKNRDTVSVTGKVNYTNDTLSMGWYRAEAHIVRAFYYFELIKRYGGVPLVTRTLDISENTHLPKATYEEVVDFIVTEIDRYKDSLQVNWKTSSFNNMDGRFSKGSALALKGRVLLYAASPLNNATNDVAKWQRAAAALNEFMVFAKGPGAYALHTDYRNYFLEANTLTSAETIWAIRYQPDNNMERQNYPISTAGGNSGVTPTHNLVSAYEDKGTPNPADPYANKDPRLAMSIVTNGSTWNNRVIDQSAGAMDDMAKTSASRTGYYLKKFVVDNLNLTQNATRAHHWPMMRYAELLLEYAEAMNEAYGPDQNNGFDMNALQAINMVRNRNGVGMPALTTTDKATFRTQLKRERRVELAFENYRFWDLLRWRDAETVLNQPVTGVQVTKVGTTYSYTTRNVENRVFDASRMYRYPFTQSEIIRSGGVLVQNPNW